MSATFARAIGPFLGGILIERSSYNVLYIAAIFVLIMSLLILKRGNKELKKNKIIL